MIARDQPFVLLDDARDRDIAAPTRLYQRPASILSASSQAQLPGLFAALREARAQGQHAAGFLTYDAGKALAGAAGDKSATVPRAWFAIFDEYQELDPGAMASILPDPAGAWLGHIQPNISRKAYARAFAQVQEYIRAGDIYQANLTFRAVADYAGDPLSLYAALRGRAAAGYGGVVWTGDDWHLSFSPELFFALQGGHVTTKPMKGTAKRRENAEADARTVENLRNDPKQRAENLMIVDLLRNDLSRVCAAGSVDVPELFKVESYPTIHQMVSSVTGDLRPGKDVIDVIEAIFPCGSITGAPKIRAMDIIEEVEADARGLYCGSIGRIDPDGSAAFNVAIRTFSLAAGEKQLSIGLGSGVVADSAEYDEWAECLAKGDFAKMDRTDFDLIETMRFEPAEGILRLEMHLERMKESARTLGFEFDRHDTRNRLHAASFHLEKPSKLRLLLARSGAVAIQAEAAPSAAADPLSAECIPLPVAREDFRLHHKTSDRAFYDDARQGSAADEIIFVDPDGFLTEGSRSAIFVESGDKLLTPPISRGLLPSVLRRELIEAGRAEERDLRAEDLQDGFFLGSSLRGLMPAKRLAK